MYREWLINIVEESFEVTSKADKENLTEAETALLNINKWAIELYDYHNEEQWYNNLKLVDRLAGSYWKLDLEEEWGKQCPCGAWDIDKSKVSYTHLSDWIREHFKHDKEYRKFLEEIEDRVFKEREKRKLLTTSSDSVE
jgi:hypothetical protein